MSLETSLRGLTDEIMLVDEKHVKDNSKRRSNG